ncbi:MAG: 2-amino-3,7-dideoxy-D-threo-hept-6-ulosonate synthase [Deltaproteobacteria bacterium]|nr:2-amino-3,7-dideoxy-D-threo-hept-6-ulosonate synthase [Deltaproteobacteria bacterium]
MHMIGKQIRMERIIDRNTSRTVIVPMDHGVSSGPIYGITDLRDAIEQVVRSGANAIVEHKGMVGAGHRRSGKDVGLIIHLSASTSLSPYPNTKTLVCTAEEALCLGADAVSIHVNIGDDMERQMLSDFGMVSSRAREWGIPLLAMIYPRGEKIANEYDPGVLKHAARLGAELGADIVKISYSGSVESFREVIAGCRVPVVIAGGEKMDSDREILEMVRGSIDAGGSGVSIGRNIFQHQDPTRMVGAISMIVHEEATVEQAAAFLNSQSLDTERKRVTV